MATIPITLRGAEKLKEELHRLKTVDRPWVIQAIAEARAQRGANKSPAAAASKERRSRGYMGVTPMTEKTDHFLVLME